MANDFRIESGKESGQYILDLVLVGDEKVTVGTVAAGFIKHHWLRWAHMDEQRELALPGFVCALRATRKSHVLIWVEKEAVKAW